MTGAGRMLLGILLAGWLADELARPDGDVEAGIEAYEAGELDAALERFEAAIARHGDRPELSYDRGLVLLAQGKSDEARRAFERATEAEDAEVRASAFYEVGNVAFDAEDYRSAIEAYIECLKARPDHSNAKWNLELAQQRLKDQEEEDEQEDESSGGSDSGGSDSGGSDTGGTGGSDTGGTGGESGESSGGSDTGGSEGGDGDTGGESGEEGSGDEGSGGEDSGGQDSGDSGGGTGEDEPPRDTDDSPEGGTGGETPPPPPVDQMDLQKALEELDEQDHFPLDRPVGGLRPPTKDW
ncbi:MAG: tetratricopeptide repeat protein [Myxococcales bacterium]|nr:tetratricopeptide repeat protein [Myxococcales bacterium]